MGATSEQFLVVASVVLLVETCGQTEVSQLDMTAPIQQDVVRFDVTTQCQCRH